MSQKIFLTAEETAENVLLNEAIAFAVEKHKDGLRKGTKMPYIVHPLEVMHILMLMKADKKLMMAGVLHDAVEDTDATLEEIAARFGEDVAALVASHTEEDKSLPWKERKKIALEHLRHAGKREQMLVLADKLSNMRAIRRDYDELGEELWQRFNRGKKDQAWYYRAGGAALSYMSFCEETQEPYYEFLDGIDYVFGDEDDEIAEDTGNGQERKHARFKAVHARDLADARFNIYTDKDTFFSISITGGKLEFAGEYYEKECRNLTCHDEYEFHYTLDAAGTDKLLTELRQKHGIEERLSSILKKEYGSRDGSVIFKAHCDELGIEAGFFSF